MNTLSTASCAVSPLFSSSFYKPYEQAVKKAFLMLCALRTDLLSTGQDVRSMTFRLKSPRSIQDKLQKRGLPVCTEAAGVLHDIAGLRVVLPNLECVYRFAALIRQSCEAEFVAMRDYIAAPKSSGYRSLHLIERIPVTVDNENLLVPVEIQLRTAAMDLWATVEHDLIYKPAAAM